ncbi:MAG: tyrosine-type recombinase/integrase [Thaumarchaeota archaeon]|nr:tyrosine-type recombinase/integrase [Nitrososphaerota archaeon]
MEFGAFIESRRAKETREGYRRGITYFLKDPESFLTLARRDRRGAEDALISLVAKHRDKVAATTLSVRLIMVKSFLDFYEVPLNWKRVRGTAPRARMVALDRGPTDQEMLRAYQTGGLREKVIISFLLSGGLRVGGLLGLRLEDVRRLSSGVGLIRIYPREVEEYSAFVSAEALDLMDAYLEERKRRAFEKLGPKSWVLRDKHYFRPEGRALTRMTVQGEMSDLWARCGVRTKGVKGEFKMLHGFRKAFKTRMEQAGMKSVDVEVLMGHYLNYYKPSLEYLEGEYLRCQPFLLIDPKYRAESRAEEAEQKLRPELDKLEREVLMGEKRLRDMEKEQRRQAETLRLALQYPKVAEALRKYSQTPDPSP